jgi:hypothetical protein
LSRSAPIVRKRDLQNAVQALLCAGVRIATVVISPDGRIAITAGDPGPIEAVTPEDKLIKAIHARAKRAEVRDPKA